MSALLSFAPKYFEYMSKAFFHDVSNREWPGRASANRMCSASFLPCSPKSLGSSDFHIESLRPVKREKWTSSSLRISITTRPLFGNSTSRALYEIGTSKSLRAKLLSCLTRILLKASCLDLSWNNFIDISTVAHDTPLYVREHTKKHLETALYNDSLFLANNKIMDYSLIVGVNTDSSELVVGIIG